MLIITWLLMHNAGAALVNSGECLFAATTAKSCCDNPLADACLDDEAKVINNRLKGYQTKLARHTAGLHDAANEARARVEVLRDSAALNLRSAEHCEQLNKKCLVLCEPLAAGAADVKAAVGRCTDNANLVKDLRDQAARDDAQAKRAQRGIK